MPIQINGNGTITGISAGGLPAGTVTSATLADGAASGTKLTVPTGSVIQIVEGSSTTQEQPTGQNYLLFLTKVITPSATANKVFVQAVAQYGLMTASGQDAGLGFKLTRTVGGTETTVYESDDPYDVYCYGSSGVSESRRHKPINYLDSPSSTSAVTYKVYARDYSSSAQLEGVCIAGAKSTIHYWR